MTRLPTGTLTFLLSDIEGSTQLLQRLGDRWSGALEQHHRLLRAAIREQGGREVTTEGDSFFIVFPTAPAAVAAAAAAQRALAQATWPDGVDVRVRMGLHTGTAAVAGGSYSGLDVHRAARIMAAGHGGQILLSDATRSLAAPLPAGITLRDLGQHRLRDLGAPEQLHQLVVDGLRSDFPPLRTLDAALSNLPTLLTTFLGRKNELAEIEALLERSRLVTLTGPGGTGKTRLALQTAARVMERYPDGLWFVPLAAISEPELVPPTIAHVLQLATHAGRSPIEDLLDHLADRRVLLLLDNFEQVAAAASTVSELLSGAPNIAVLATSRSRLQLNGEQEYPVSPLALPDLRHLPDPERLSRYEAVALFTDRASAARPGFAITAENASTIAEICVRLDGLPLAIELAAARVRLLAPQAILARLGHRLGMLVGGPRDMPERQRTLRGAIEWSYELLDDTQQELFSSLSVFVGGAALDAIAAVCADAAGEHVLDAVAALVDQSLVRVVDGRAPEPRFGMLETIREFALERVEAAERLADLQARHAEWYADMSEELAPRIMGPEQRQLLDRLEDEHGNLRAAIVWAVENQRPDLALRLTSRLWRMWQMRGHIVEGLDRTRLALAMPAAAEHASLRADALEAAGGLAYWRGDVPETRQWYERALEARRALGDPAAIAEALFNLSFAFSYVKPDVEADDLVMARRLGDEAMELFRQQGNESGEARTLTMLASIDAGLRDFAAMEDKSLRAELVFRRLDDRFYLGWALWCIAFARVGMGRVDDARGPASDALEIFVDADDISGYVTVLEMAAIIASRSGDAERAARLSGAVARAGTETGLGANLFPRAVLGFDPEGLRTGADTAAAWGDGSRMPLEGAVAYAKEAL